MNLLKAEREALAMKATAAAGRPERPGNALYFKIKATGRNEQPDITGTALILGMPPQTFTGLQDVEEHKGRKQPGFS